MELGLTLVGISHRTAPLEVRERYVVNQEDLPACLAALANVPGVREAFVLSTCNRTEALVVGEPGVDVAAGVRAQLFRNLAGDPVYAWSGLQALIHVFRVAAGLDSVVVGESEVLAQMNRPWLEPSTFEDQHGLVSNVTFVEGLVHFRDTWFAYYGQSDSTLGVATYEVGDRYSSLGS